MTATAIASSLTPAENAGIVKDVTRLRLKSDSGYENSVTSNGLRYSNLVWLLSIDDKSCCPWFRSEDGSVQSMFFGISELEVIEDIEATPLLQVPVPALSVVQPVPPPVFVEQTPAQKRGIHPGIIFSYAIAVGYADTAYAEKYLWVLRQDDETSLPYFDSICGNEKERCLPVAGMTVCEDQSFTQKQPYQKDLPEGMISKHQADAIATFTTMRDRAEEYMLTGVAPSKREFHHGRGICDNIVKATAPHVSDSHMINVKNNVIRRLPSFSGAYHYPVKGPECIDGDADDMVTEAEISWDNSSDKWAGEYGALRLAQLDELIEYIRTDWSDDLIGEMTSAEQYGMTIGTMVMDKRDGSLWKLHRDDGSREPYFRPADNKDDDENGVKYMSLQNVKVLNVKNVSGEMTVPEFVQRFDEIKAAMVEKNSLIVRLQNEIAVLRAEQAILDTAMANQHKVKRIDK